MFPQVLSLVLAAWLAVYATHTLHLLPAHDGGMPATTAVQATVAELPATAAHIARCTIEAVRDLGRTPFVVATVALMVAAWVRLQPAMAPLRVAAPVPRVSSPGDARALLQVFRN